MAITVIGDAFIDIIMPTHGIKPGETHHRTISISCGGTANVAIQIAKLGEKVIFLGKVGNDVMGRYFLENLRSHNVETIVLCDEERPTGLCASLVHEDGERSMIASRGANDNWFKEKVNAYLDRIMESKLIYFSGYSLLKNSDAISYLMKRCHSNCEIWFNPGAPNIIDTSFIKIIRNFVDVLVLNMDEAKSITNESKMGQIVDKLSKIVDSSIITDGKIGCVIVTGKEWVQIPQNTVIENVDTTGAGDAFSAGFMVGRFRGMDNSECAHLGHETAASFLKEKIIK